MKEIYNINNVDNNNNIEIGENIDHMDNLGNWRFLKVAGGC